MYRLLDLFSGIGGFSLGLERSGGFKTVAFCEIEEYPRRVLAKHWPEVPIYEDVRTLTAARLAADGIEVDAICGGFPCQDISLAGKGAGLSGERSGLWREYARLIGEIRPRYVIVENVSALLSRGLGDVLSDLATVGYDAEWHCIPASAIDAPHRRDRFWAVAYPNSQQHESRGYALQWDGADGLHQADLPNTMRKGLEGHGGGKHIPPEVPKPRRGRHDVSDADSERELQPGWMLRDLRGRIGNSREETRGWWDAEPGICRVANGVPKRVDRIEGLGNAVVPQIPEMIGLAILAAESAS
jgi:DNA (cytosine-5)-methyltransferase 1